jgi:cation-transporting ATPase E
VALEPAPGGPFAPGVYVLGAVDALAPALAEPRLPQLAALALVALGDELRPGVERTVADLQRRGVALKVVSGDDPRTVAALVARLGLRDDEPVTGSQLEALSPGEFDETVERRTVFGRIAPKQKSESSTPCGAAAATWR